MRFLLLLIISTFTLTACGSSQEPADMHISDDNMQVYADIQDVHRCSRISPEIEVTDFPRETAMFDVSLQDKSDARRMHGGGTWKNDGSGIIPEGALTRLYLGACPPDSNGRYYEYVVKALATDGRVLDQNRYIFEQE